MAALRLLALLALVACAVAIEKHCTGDCRTADANARMNKVMIMKEKQHQACVAAGRCPTLVPSITGRVRCRDGSAGEYACKGLDLMSFTSLADMGTNLDASDIWGWTDPLTKMEVAITGVMDGTSFVDVTDAENPRVLGFMPATNDKHVIWHDIKVYKNHAFVVSEIRDHGMQVFDLTRLRSVRGVAVSELKEAAAGVADVPQFEPDALYHEFGSSHNIVINEETGFAYSVGTRTCNSGLHMVDIRDPVNPTFAGCFGEDGYTHDAQCVVYRGPDMRYHGSELCFCYNEDTLTIVNVDDKENPVMVAREGYRGSQYTHQGWLNANETFLLLNDELDEVENANHHTRSMVWNVTDLERPELYQSFYSTETVIDHNLYIHNGLAYEANYCGGLRVLDVADMSQPLSELMYFDVAPDCDTPLFQGSWSVYPYFESGNIIVSSIERGLFVLAPSGR